MTEEKSREVQMHNAVGKIAKDYLLEGIDDYDAIVEAASEVMVEDFEIEEAVCEDLANKLIGPIWNDLVDEVENERADATDWHREREEARIGAY